LTIKAKLDKQAYPTSLHPTTFDGEWNYVIAPRMLA
jgi:hypothetical protein